MMTKSTCRSLALAFALCLLGTSYISGVAAADSKLKASPKPVALVLSAENITNNTLRAYDHIYAGTRIDLRPDGVLRVSYLATCIEETIRGGRVRFREDSRKLAKGAKADSVETTCTTADSHVDKNTEEAFETVQALSPFLSEHWRERIIATQQPIFQWPMGLQVTQVTLRIIDLDSQPEELVWETTSAANHFVYPADATALEAGKPYRIEVAYPGTTVRQSTFSIDPGLNIPDSIANRLVPLEW
jgi:hypothetical protein